jgi:flavin reductase (DIM6/NTAB) family NADH-FMN oxidoreductase RutF
MKETSLRVAQKLGEPNPFALVVSADADGRPNLMAVSWWTYASYNPPSLLVCLGSQSYTRELIAKSGEFTLNLVDKSLREAAFRCGTCSGRTVNKAEALHIALESSTAVAPPTVRDSKVVLECRVTGQADAGDHKVIIAEIVAVRVDAGREHLFALDGYARLDALK